MLHLSQEKKTNQLLHYIISYTIKQWNQHIYCHVQCSVILVHRTHKILLLSSGSNRFTVMYNAGVILVHWMHTILLAHP